MPLSPTPRTAPTGAAGASGASGAAAGRLRAVAGRDRAYRAGVRSGAGAVMLSSSFVNSRRDRIRGGVTAPLASPTRHRDRYSLERLARDCDEALRNNHLVRCIAQALVDLVVGPRPHLEVRTADPDWNAAAEKLFNEWADDPERCDAFGQQTVPQMAASCVTGWLKDGTTGFIKRRGDGRRGHRAKAGPALEGFEGVRLRNPAGEPEREGFSGGVQTGPGGLPRTYWVGPWSRYGHGVDEPVAIDAGAVILSTDFRLRTPGQLRAEPRLTSVLHELSMIESSKGATLAAFELAAMVALFFHREYPGGTLESDLANAMVASGEANSAQDAIDRGAWGMGTVMEGGLGERVTQIKPEHPTSNFIELYRTILRTVCASLDLPLELVIFYHDRNYAASRSSIAGSWKRVEMNQRWAATSFLSPATRCFLAWAMAAGELPYREDWREHEWVLPSMPSLDLKSEVVGLIDAVAGGLMTREKALRVMGEPDVERFYLKRGDEIKRERGLGIETARPTQPSRTEDEAVDENTAENTDADTDDNTDTHAPDRRRAGARP